MSQKSTARFMAMKGSGYYSKATIGAKHVMDNASGMVVDAVDRMQLADDGSIFRVSDMGSADGGTSVDLWRTVLSHVRAKVPSRPIEIVYTDLPRNDFSQTFRNALGLAGEESYAQTVPGVYVLASGTSPLGGDSRVERLSHTLAETRYVGRGAALVHPTAHPLWRWHRFNRGCHRRHCLLGRIPHLR